MFKPERDEFDEVMAIRVLPAMGYRGYRMVSKAMHINDVPGQLTGIQLSQRTNRVDPTDIIGAINQVCGLTLKATAEPVLPWLVPAVDPMTGRAEDKSVGTAIPETKGSGGKQTPARDVPVQAPITPGNVHKSDEPVLALAMDMMTALRKRDFPAMQAVLQQSMQLSALGQVGFRQAVATLQYFDPSLDQDGLAELAMGTAQVLAANA